MPSYDFVQNPIIPNLYQQPPQGMPVQQQQQMYNQYQYNQYQQIQPQQIPQQAPKITSGGFKFTVKPDEDEEPVDKSMIITAPVDPNLLEKKETRVGRPRKQPETINSNEIVKADGAIEQMSTLNTYGQTTEMLNTTLNQLDMVAAELKDELEQVRSSRVMKRKYDYIIGLSGNLCQLIGTKATVIREINNAISKSNDLDYRREKDRKDAESSTGDDKYIMDLYNSFIKNPMGTQQQIAPSPIQSSVLGTPIIRASTPNASSQNNQVDAGYLNYLSNVTPEQNMMFYEQDPNVKTVVVFDAASGNKFFQVMNVATGQVIPNVPVLDNRFMEDTTIDIKNRIAKNNNLHENYPVIVINEGVTKEY